METIVEHAQGLVYSLLCLMPSVYQKASLNALLGAFDEREIKVRLSTTLGMALVVCPLHPFPFRYSAGGRISTP